MMFFIVKIKDLQKKYMIMKFKATLTSFDALFINTNSVFDFDYLESEKHYIAYND